MARIRRLGNLHSRWNSLLTKFFADFRNQTEYPKFFKMRKMACKIALMLINDEE